MSKSSMKSPAATRSLKRVTFKVQTGFPSTGQTSDKLESAMRAADEIIKLESNNQQLLKEIKSLYSQYHAQCLTRFQVEKLLEQNCTGNGKNLAMLEEKKKAYEAIVAQYIPA